MLRFSHRFLHVPVTTALCEEKLRAAASLAPITRCNITDISSGCGSFFKVEVESPKFEGLDLLGQHRLVNTVLKQEINNLHGVTIVTSAPEKSASDENK